MIQQLKQLDESLARWANTATRRSNGMSRAAVVIALAGSWSAAGLLTLWWLQAFIRGDARKRRVAERAYLGVGLTYLAVELIGRIAPRSRPFADGANLQVLVDHAEDRSFPSRHVASAFAMSIAVTPTSSLLAGCFGAIGGLLGVSRCAAGIHYPSDVIAGAILGTLIGRLVRIGKAPSGEAESSSRSARRDRAARDDTRHRRPQ